MAETKLALVAVGVGILSISCVKLGIVEFVAVSIPSEGYGRS
jgi:hypothetical protein